MLGILIDFNKYYIKQFLELGIPTDVHDFREVVGVVLVL